MSDLRVRFAPSPTGPLHIGGARSALFNYLFAKKNKGHFVLRIEDTDRERSDRKYEEMIFDSFDWLGIEPDEGPKEGGDFGPYRQSERIGLYKSALERLLAEKKIFYCPHLKSGEETGKFQVHPVTPGSSGLEAEEKRDVFKKETLQEAPAFRPGSNGVHWCEFRDGGGESPESILRYKTPKQGTIAFKDLVRGEIRTDCGTIGDFSVAKNLETPLYNFANVIDDSAMRISHVLRGEDHIANTPKQILLQEALGLPSMLYGHFPLILGPDRSKLSKRHGPTSLIEYKAQGYLPEALRNYLALLGWNPGTDQEIFTLDQLIAAFTLEKIQKSGAIFDIAKLDWINGEYIRQTAPEKLLELATPFLETSGLDVAVPPKEKLLEIIGLEQPRLKRLAEIGERADFYFKLPEYERELLSWKEMANDEIRASLEKSLTVLTELPDDKELRKNAERLFLEAAASFSSDRGKLLWPLRVALSGRGASPGPFDIISVLGRDESIKRLQAAIAKLGE